MGALLRDDLYLQVAARLAPHLLGNKDIALHINGQRVDPEPLIEGEPTDVSLDTIPAKELGGREVPSLLIVDWNTSMKRAAGLVLCNEHGAALVVLPDTAPSAPLKSTGYIRWSGFSELSGADLMLSQLQHGGIISAAAAVLDRHVKQRIGEISATIVARLKAEKSYPYPDAPTDPIQRAEKDTFDLVAVTARAALDTGSRQHRAMSAKLLQLALEERPESLDVILEKALGLSEEERTFVAGVLRDSSLGSIFGAAAEVTRRLDLIATLRDALYTPAAAAEMREVDQLHPLVKENAWLFGEEWRLSRSESELTNVLRAVFPDDVMLEAELQRVGGKAVLPNGKGGRVDLVLQRTVLSPNARHRLVVELKRPTAKLGNTAVSQMRGYASALSRHGGVGAGKWEFWLVGAETKTEIEGQLSQRDRARGHIETGDSYDIWVMTWGELLDRAAQRLEFYRHQLHYDISQEEAVAKVRARHAELLPASTPAATEESAA